MATGRGGVGGKWDEFVSEHLGSISHPPHLAGAFEIWCQLTVGAEVHVLSHEGQLWVPPGSAFWGTLTSFAHLEFLNNSSVLHCNSFAFSRVSYKWDNIPCHL